MCREATPQSSLVLPYSSRHSFVTIMDPESESLERSKIELRLRKNSEMELKDFACRIVTDNSRPFTVLDEEEGEEEAPMENLKWCLVGKIIADKVVNFQAMRNTMAMLWRPLQGVQVHKAPCGCRSEKVVKSIGNYVGTYVESDEKNFDGSWKEFIRVKIKIDVSKPIMAFMKIKKPGGDWLNLEFNYERLGIACFICGRVGHSDKFYRCLLEFENIVYKLSKEVRAPPRRSQIASAGEIWLRDGGRGGRGSEWKNPYDYGNSAIRVDSPTENDTINLKEIFKGGDYASNLGLDGRKNLDFEDSGGLDKERVIFIEGKRRKMDEVVTTSQIEEGILGHKEPQAHGVRVGGF
ncbi:uncharacterized protein LOC125370919 [Ricinus communis]|uniref:uncharacterized protein LOC125370919 n=1 Tax=Ricinus communis TaxID=3988 RepID=UPI00201A322D|nr:uncharacterized protein LOC125370919 [Ricinus communis]